VPPAGAEIVGIVDSAVRRMRSAYISANEVIGITDTVVKMAIKAIAETVGLTDTFVRRLWSIRISTTEVIGLTETFIRRLRSIRIINETVGIVESFIRRLWSIRISLEVEGIVDRMIRAGQAIHLMVSDVIGITDSHMGVKALLTRAKVIISRMPFTRMRKDRFL
jgi:predicted membrane protein